MRPSSTERWSRVPEVQTAIQQGQCDLKSRCDSASWRNGYQTRELTSDIQNPDICALQGVRSIIQPERQPQAEPQRPRWDQHHNGTDTLFTRMGESMTVDGQPDSSLVTHEMDACRQAAEKLGALTAL